MQMFNQSVCKMSKFQLLFIVLVALVSVVYGGGDAFIPLLPLPAPIDVPMPSPIEVGLPSLQPVPLPSFEPMPLPSLEPIPLPSLEPVPIPSVAPIEVVLPSIKPEEPHTGTGPSFNDVSSSNGSPPDCYYPWLDVLKCKLMLIL